MDVRGDGTAEIVNDVPVGLEKGLPNYWYPVLQAEELKTGKPYSFRVMDQDLVAWRDANDHPRIVVDRCPHRNAKLSLGHVLEGDLQCPLHGIRYNHQGQCVRIPWEPDLSPLLGKIKVTAYPTRELGGYIWAYLGDENRFPVPHLEDELPEELSNGEKFIWYRLPTDYWKTNWLVAIDGGDAYHAVMLHANSQAAPKKGETAGRAGKKNNVPMEDRRMEIVKTDHGARGIGVDALGNPINHGHLTNEKMLGDRFILPCITSNPIRPVPGEAPYTSRLWQYPIDEELTRVERYLCFRANSDEERAESLRLFEDVTLPRLQKIGEEDKMVAESQGDLISARSNETLFSPDADTVQVRRLIRKAFLSSRDGQRVDVESSSLVFPI